MTRELRMIDKVNKVVNLYDLYGGLLTERQSQLVEMYYFDDWSLAEIAENQGVSRQAIHDNLRRAEEQLEAYERALGLFATEEKRVKSAQSVLALWMKFREDIPEPLRSEFQEALEELAPLERPTDRGDERA